MVKLTTIAKSDFQKLFFERPTEFLERINLPEVFVVKQFYPGAEILAMRAAVLEQAKNQPAAWHPLLDGCPDYHRIHDDYEKAYVKGKMHVYYHHGNYERNAKLFTYFREIFEMKDLLSGGVTQGAIHHKPSDGIIARVNFQHYPEGGGYQAQHIDPAGIHARIQTLVVASQYGQEFKTGGIYAKATPEDEAHFVDPVTEPGDLLVLSPAIPHGVAPINPEQPLNWESARGRWMILPLYVWSDYPHPENVKPAQVT